MSIQKQFVVFDPLSALLEATTHFRLSLKLYSAIALAVFKVSLPFELVFINDVPLAFLRRALKLH